MNFTFISLLFSLFFLEKITAQTPIGKWATIDDQTGQTKSHVEIFEQNGKHFGKIVQLLSAENHNCDRCTDHRRDQPILGMVILENSSWQNGLGQGGKVLFPKQGKWYDVKYWLAEGDPDTLILRGYWGFLYRTQTWKRVN